MIHNLPKITLIYVNWSYIPTFVLFILVRRHMPMICIEYILIYLMIYSLHMVHLAALLFYRLNLVELYTSLKELYDSHLPSPSCDPFTGDSYIPLPSLHDPHVTHVCSNTLCNGTFSFLYAFQEWHDHSSMSPSTSSSSPFHLTPNPFISQYLPEYLQSICHITTPIQSPSSSPSMPIGSPIGSCMISSSIRERHLIFTPQAIQRLKFGFYQGLPHYPTSSTISQQISVISGFQQSTPIEMDGDQRRSETANYHRPLSVSPIPVHEISGTSPSSIHSLLTTTKSSAAPSSSTQSLSVFQSSEALSTYLSAISYLPPVIPSSSSSMKSSCTTPYVHINPTPHEIPSPTTLFHNISTPSSFSSSPAFQDIIPTSSMASISTNSPLSHIHGSNTIQSLISPSITSGYEGSDTCDTMSIMINAYPPSPFDQQTMMMDVFPSTDELLYDHEMDCCCYSPDPNQPLKRPRLRTEETPYVTDV